MNNQNQTTKKTKKENKKMGRFSINSRVLIKTRVAIKEKILLPNEIQFTSFN